MNKFFNFGFWVCWNSQKYYNHEIDIWKFSNFFHFELQREILNLCFRAQHIFSIFVVNWCVLLFRNYHCLKACQIFLTRKIFILANAPRWSGQKRKAFHWRWFNINELYSAFGSECRKWRRETKTKRKRIVKSALMNINRIKCPIFLPFFGCVNRSRFSNKSKIKPFLISVLYLRSHNAGKWTIFTNFEKRKKKKEEKKLDRSGFDLNLLRDRNSRNDSEKYFYSLRSQH